MAQCTESLTPAAKPGGGGRQGRFVPPVASWMSKVK
jgi:hypothetical protein